MVIRTSPQRHCWLGELGDALRFQGCAIVENVIPSEIIAETRRALYRTRHAIVADVGVKRLQDAGEVGVLRLPMKYEPIFVRYLAIPEILQIVDATVSSMAILHLQNGFILPPIAGHVAPEVFQTAAGRNTSGRDRLVINHQFTRSFIKQQIDYVRALGPALVQAQPARTQQLLGWYTRVVTSLDEYYRPSAERLYRKNQG